MPVFCGFDRKKLHYFEKTFPYIQENPYFCRDFVRIVMKVELFVPCIIDQFFPEVAVHTMKVLARTGVEVEYNPEQTCCGRFAYNAGFVEDAKELGDKFLNDFSYDGPVVAPSAACVHYIKKHYPELFFNTANHLNFKRMVANVYELTDFLVNKVQFDDFGAEFPYKVTFHDSCSALRGLGLGKEARQLLSKVKGLELVEMKQADMCCGADFSLEINHEDLALGMASHKVRNALNTGAEYIVSTDMTCLMHQRAYIEKENLPIKVIHIADVLASGWE